MNYLLRHLKGIANFLAALILLQSCVVYQKNPTPIEEVTKQRDINILIETTEGAKYRVRWIEEKEDKIYSIANTERYFIDTAVIQSIHQDNIPLKDIPFQMIQNRVGSFTVKTVSQRYTFIKIDVKDQNLVCYKKLRGRIYSINIPKDQISSIRLIDDQASERASKRLAVGLAIAGSVGIGLLTYGIIHAFKNMEMNWQW